MDLLTAQSVMTDSVVSVSPDSSLLDVVRLFVEEEIHGAPVVDDAGEFIGVISTSDLLRAQHDEHDKASATTDYLREIIEFAPALEPEDLTEFQDRLAQRTVSDVMTKSFTSVAHDAPVTDVARCLRENQIHRVWVVESGRVCGVISALDLMSVIEKFGESG